MRSIGRFAFLKLERALSSQLSRRLSEMPMMAKYVVEASLRLRDMHDDDSTRIASGDRGFA